MKFLTQFSRILVGILFILSGLIKLNDPTGFSYKLDEYFSVFSADFEATQDSLYLIVASGQTEEVFSYPILNSDRNFTLGISQTPWERKQAGDTLSAGIFTVEINGDHKYQEELMADSMMPAGKWTVQARLGNNSLMESVQVELQGPDTLGSVVNDTKELDVSPYIKADGFLAGFFNSLRPYSLSFAIFTSLLEAVIGFAILIGWQAGFSILILFLVWAFFTFLTWYSWVYDKVTDCGCFGDALPMNPYESFIKNIVLGVFVVILIFGRKYIKPLFSNPFGVKLLTVLSVLMVAFSLYCRNYLPVIDFLHYKEGSNLCEQMQVPEGERVSPWKVTTYLYKDAEGNEVEVVYDSDKNTFEPNVGVGWSFISVKSEEIKAEAYEPPIHDFKFYDSEKTNDYIEDFLSSDKKLLAVMHNLSEANVDAVKELNAIAAEWTKAGHAFWALTASSPEEAEAFRHEHQLNFEFHFGDNTNLKSIIRSNPGLLLITDSCTVKKVWPARRIPKYKRLEKLASK